MNNMKKVALVTLSVFTLNTLSMGLVSAIDTNDDSIKVEKAKSLGILKETTEKTATMTDAIIASLRTKMLLDYRVGLMQPIESITGNNTIDSFLDTAKELYEVNITKANAYMPVTSDILVTEINKIIPVNVNKTGTITKKDLAVVMVDSYEKTTQSNFDKLEGKTENTTEDNKDDVLGGALDDLFSDNTEDTTETTTDETSDIVDTNTNIKVEVVVTSPWELNLKTTDYLKKVEVSVGDEQINNSLIKTDEGYTIKLEKEIENGDNVTIKGLDADENVVFTESVDVNLDKDVYVKQLNDSSVIGYSNIAEINVSKDTTLDINISGLFDSDDMGDFYLLDKDMNIEYQRKIRNNESYDRDVEAGKYFLLVENKTSGNGTLHISINDNSFDVDTYELTLGDVNMTFDANSTSNKDVNSNDVVYFVWTVQNTGDKAVVLNRLKLETSGSADVKTLKIGEWDNGNCIIEDDYEVSEDRGDFVFLSNDNDKAISLDVTETKQICVEATDFLGEEGDYVDFSIDTRDLAVLFSVKEHPGLYSKMTVSSFLDGYGKYTLRSTSILYSQASDVLVKVPVGSNVPLFKWDVDILGQSVNTDNIIISVSNLNRNFTDNEIDNVKLGYVSESGDEQIVDIDTSPSLSGDTYTFTFKNNIELPTGKGKFILYADLASTLDGNNLKVEVLKTNSAFKNADDDTIYPVSDIISPDLLILKSDLDISSTIKTTNTLVNTTSVLGTFTVNNIGGNEVTISRVNLVQNSDEGYLTGKFSIGAIGYVDGMEDDISPENVTLVTNYENILGQTSYNFAITTPVKIEANQSKTFVLLGKINDDGVNDGDIMQWRIPVNGITLVTNYGSTVTNENELGLDILRARKSGKALITMYDDVNDAKIKSPSDKYVSLGRFTVDASYEDVRLNKVVFNAIKNDTENGFLDVEKLYVVASDDTECTTDDINFDNVKGVGIVGSTDSVIVSMNEVINRSDDGANTLPNYCVYGKLLTNQNGFEKGNLKVKLADSSSFEVYGVDTGNLYNSSSLTVSGEGRTVNFYPAVLSFNTKSVVPNTTVGPNKQLMLFELTNNDDKNIKVKELKFKITDAPDFVIRNFKLVDNVTDDVIATKYLWERDSDGAPVIVFDNLDYNINKYYTKDIKLVSDVYTRTNDVSATISLTVNYGNPNEEDKRSNSSVQYVAVEDDGTEIPYNTSIYDVWFVKTEDSNITGNEATFTIVDVENTGMIASCDLLIDNSKNTANFNFDENNNIHTGVITLGLVDGISDEAKQSIIDSLRLSSPSYLQLSNIAQSVDTNNNITYTFDYTLDSNMTNILTDIPLLSTDKILLNTYLDNCYTTTNSNSTTPDYYIDRNNSVDNIILETNSQYNNLKVTSTNNNASGTAGAIEPNDVISVEVSDIDNQGNALYDLLGDIDSTGNAVSVSDITGTGVVDTININDKVAFRFSGISSDLSITDGGDTNAATASIKFNSTNEYQIQVTFEGDDTISDVSAATDIEVFVKDSNGDWISIGQYQYNNDF